MTTRTDDGTFSVHLQVNLQNGQECGGAYLKLLSDSPDLNPAGFRDQTPYTIMFGPDKCGNDNKVRTALTAAPRPLRGTNAPWQVSVPCGGRAEVVAP